MGEASDPLELFPIDECQDTYLASVNDNCSVIYKAPSPDWSMLGGIDDPETDHVIKEDDGKTFFYQKWYDPDLARFEDYELLSRPDDVPAHRFCSCCLKMERIQEVREESFIQDAIYSKAPVNIYDINHFKNPSQPNKISECLQSKRAMVAYNYFIVQNCFSPFICACYFVLVCLFRMLIICTGFNQESV